MFHFKKIKPAIMKSFIHCSFFAPKQKTFFLFFLSLFSFGVVHSQVVCHFDDASWPLEDPDNMICSNNSEYFNDNFANLPTIDDSPIFINVNLFFLKNSEGQGNFEKGNPEHDAFITSFTNRANAILRNIQNPENCGEGVIKDIKLQFKFTRHYDIANTAHWDQDNCTNLFCCPGGDNWYLDSLDDLIVSDPNIPRGINIYYNTSGNLYEDIVVNGSACINETSIPSGQCSMSPSFIDLDRSMRINAPNAWLKYYFLENCYTDFPFSTTRGWEIEANADYLTHEIGHALGLLHDNYCNNSNVMNNTSSQVNDYFRPLQVGRMHRELGRSNLRQFVDCDQTHATSQVVNTDETWDFDRRVYGDIIVETGATLILTCKLLMPLNGRITVKRGARLILDGGTITRANTCIGNEKWQGIQIFGNNEIAHTASMLDENISLPAEAPGVVIVKNDAIIEHAKAAITTNPAGIGYPTVKGFWNGLIHASGSRFLNNIHAIGFMRDDQVDGTENINLSAFVDCEFINEDGLANFGVTTWEANNIFFDNCTFQNLNMAGILTYDSGLTIKNSTFSGNKHGVEVKATAPLSAELVIGGDQTLDGNFFTNNEVGVYGASIDKLDLARNTFNNNYVGFYAVGESEYEVNYNTFIGGEFGIGNIETGKGYKKTTCNEYFNTTVGMYNGGNTLGLQFDHEKFECPYNVMIDAYSFNPGQMAAQGNQGNARWNFFTANSEFHIFTGPFTTPFSYWHPSPTIHPLLKPACSTNENTNCTHISDYYTYETMGGQLGCLSEELTEDFLQLPCFDKACLIQIKNEIDQLQTQIGQQGNDDVLQAALDQLKFQKRHLLNYLLSNLFTTESYDEIETILDIEGSQESRKKLIGLKLRRQKWVDASILLSDLPVLTQDDYDFKIIQEINLNRLAEEENYVLSLSDKSILLNLASQKQASAVYAQSLLGLLANHFFDADLPNLAQLRFEKESSSPPKTIAGMTAIPNPVTEHVCISFPPNIKLHNGKLSVVNNIGERVKEVLIPEGNLSHINLDLNSLKTGLYFILLEQEGKTLGHLKLVKQQ